MAQRLSVSRRWFSIKGADEPVRGPSPVGHGANSIAPSGVPSRIWSVGGGRCPPSRACWTVQSTATARVVGVVGPPGIGKSRLVREVAAMAAARGVEVFTTFCESHTSEVPFHVVARLLRAATGVDGSRRAGRPRSSARPGSRRRPRGFAAASMTCWASPTRMLALPDDRSGCASAAVDRAGECRVVGPRNPGGLCH